MKIAVIGGAGVRTIIFINGLLKRYKHLGIDKVVLYDIDTEKLDVIASLCEHVIKRANADLIVEAVTNAVDAITAADYIVTTIRVGGDKSRVIDEEIAFNENVIGQETTGVGGFSMAARTIPVLLEYAEIARIHAPNAWIFNFSNPSGLVTQALQGAGYNKVIGICDAPSSTKHRMAEYLGLSDDEVHIEFFGLNHLSWIRSVKVENNGVLEEIMPNLLSNNDFLKSINEFSVFDPELIRAMEHLPNEYLYYYYHSEKALKNMLSTGCTRGKQIEEINTKMFDELKKIDIKADSEKALQIFLRYMWQRENSYMVAETGRSGVVEENKHFEIPEGIGYADVMLDCIDGFNNDKAKNLVLSIKNAGSINGLHNSDVIEVTCKVSKSGIEPIHIGDAPEMFFPLIKTIKTYERHAAAAIKNKSLIDATFALAIHPLVNSWSVAKNLVNKYSDIWGWK